MQNTDELQQDTWIDWEIHLQINYNYNSLKTGEDRGNYNPLYRKRM